MGKALLSDSEKPNLPLLYQKQFLFNLGVNPFYIYVLEILLDGISLKRKLY